MNYKLLFVLGLSTLLGCKKTNNNNPYSNWYVNSDSFKTNDVKMEIGKDDINFITNNFTNGFAFNFTGGYVFDMPLELNCVRTTESVCFGIHYNGVTYVAKDTPIQYIVKTTVKTNLTQYKLDTTWFYAGNDSIKVHGIFSEPYSY